MFALVLACAQGCGASAASSIPGNPFAGATMFVNPDYAANVQRSIDLSPAAAPAMRKVKSIPTGIWITQMAAVPRVSAYLDEALAQQESDGRPVVTVFVIYNLPDRDCHSHASQGELRSANGGLNAYKKDFIDEIAAAFRAHPLQRIVAIVEPDSLPNIATNVSDSRCAAAERAYREGTAYAIRQLAGPNVALYLDSGHAGWLGWPDNQRKTARVVREVLDAAGGPGLIRGFASNVANYSVLRATKELLSFPTTPCRDELTFRDQLSAAYAAEGIPNVNWLIDTSRNGVDGIRRDTGYWCNNRGAGLGERPKANPAPGIDAYFWVKPPGESDGTSDPNAPGYDLDCGKEDAARSAPRAGEWFHSYFVELVTNANPPL